MSTKGRMDKEIVASSRDNITNKKEWATAIHNKNMDEFHRYNNEQKKADTGENNLHGSIYMKFKSRWKGWWKPE